MKSRSQVKPATDQHNHHSEEGHEKKTPSAELKVRGNRLEEYSLRCALVKRHQYSKPYIDRNEDVFEVPEFRSCFTKSLAHDSQGDVKEDEALKMLAGVRKCKCYLEKILYPGNLRLVNPSVVYSWDLVGPYKSSVPIEAPPGLRSEETAAEMAELYAMALLRDLPFSKYASSPAVTEVLKDLNQLIGLKAPARNHKITPDLLFRGSSEGDLKGPYISQFLYLPYSVGVGEVSQKYRLYAPGVDFMTSWEDALSCQNGIVKESIGTRTDPRYIITLRDGATFVHLDEPVQCGMQVARILTRLKCPGPKGSPFGRSIKERPFVDLGSVDLYDIMCAATRVAMMSCWYHKWSICRPRPEELGILLTRMGEDSPLHSQLKESSLLKKVHRKFGTSLLPQAYPEGAPCHPAYPAGHAVYAGVVSTVLKAFYDDDFMLDGYEPNEDGSELVPLGMKLRVGDELDKFASNLALLRCAAGIHYRSDGAGIELGEEIAIIVLQDYVLRYCQTVKFSFHRRNGCLVTISNDDC